MIASRIRLDQSVTPDAQCFLTQILHPWIDLAIPWQTVFHVLARGIIDWTRRFGVMNISGMAAFHLPASQYEQGESRSVTACLHVYLYTWLCSTAFVLPERRASAVPHVNIAPVLVVGTLTVHTNHRGRKRSPP